MEPENILLVVAHPDDDVLGFGGAAQRLTRRGHTVRAAILCGGVAARAHRPNDADLADDMRRATDLLGMADPIIGQFPNIQMNNVPHLELVQFVEAAIVEVRATRIFTLHPGDLNDDHRQVSLATQAAARLPQRGSNMAALKSLHFMEVPSSTDWAFSGASHAPFMPDTFLEIEEEGVAGKIKALECYRDVMRPYPHPRSVEAITSLAEFRGAQAGLDRAEAFQTAFMDLGAVLF